MLLAVGIVIVVAVVTSSTATIAVDEIFSCVVSPRPALAVVSPAGAEAIALFVELVVGAEREAINRVAISVCGYDMGARRDLGSRGLVPTLTAAPP